jgi:hexosaminidase
VSVALVPLPRSLDVRSGTVSWRSPVRVAVEHEWREVVETFARDLESSIGWSVEVVDATSSPDVNIRRVGDCGDEGYRLTIDTEVTIDASTSAGASYGLTVLRQLGPNELWSSAATLEAFELPRLFIEDEPQFSWRGVHLDVARHFFDVATVCRMIDLIAAHRLNRLHLHLNDDQGWRVDVPNWPRLRSVASTRRSSPDGHDVNGLDDDVVHAGCYSAEDLRVIFEHARQRFVTIVPEIDLPGHAQAVIAAYPDLGNGDEPLEVWTRWGISEHVLNVGEGALSFAEDVVRYVASCFPGSPVHIGGDECPLTEWEDSELAQAVMAQHGFTQERQLQGLFTERLTAALLVDGHEVLAWDDVMDADVDDDVVICAWRHSERGRLAAESGHDVVMAPMQFLYLDWLNTDSPDEPVALAPPPTVTTWEKVYRFSVIPPGLDEKYWPHVRGAQVQLWSEYIATQEHLDYMAFPRTAVFSEVVWGTRESLDAFRVRLDRHVERLSAMGVHFHPLAPR